MKHIFKCAACVKYTMKVMCDCGTETINPKPLKFSLDDKFSRYRRMAKAEEYMKRGLL